MGQSTQPLHLASCNRISANKLRNTCSASIPHPVKVGKRVTTIRYTTRKHHVPKYNHRHCRLCARLWASANCAKLKFHINGGKIAGVPHLRAVKAPNNAGFRIARYGSHVVMRDGVRIVSIPWQIPSMFTLWLVKFAMLYLITSYGLAIRTL